MCYYRIDKSWADYYGTSLASKLADAIESPVSERPRRLFTIPWLRPRAAGKLPFLRYIAAGSGPPLAASLRGGT